jgi:UDP-4-amino-4-deoxy-L-arabinose-oxoglutarate aminotransferase
VTAGYIHHSAPAIDEADVAAVTAQLGTGQLAAGDAAARFEALFGAAIGAPADAVLAVGSGTHALAVALGLVGVRAGDAVAVPTYACRALVDAGRTVGAREAICDVDDSYCLDLSALDAAPAAVVAFHPFGRRMALGSARELGCPVIEDCAHLLSRSTEADVSIYSFHTTKLLAAGEGGAVAARSECARARLADLRRGHDATGRFVARGFVPLSDLGASLALAQLERREAFARRRRELAAVYDEQLAGVLERGPDPGEEVPFRWVAQTAAAFEPLREALHARGVAVRRPVDPLLHHELGLDAARFPVAERLYGRTVSLPLYPALTDEQARHVAAQVREVLA